VALVVFLCDLGTVRQCGIISFSIGLWYCFDSVVSFVYLFDFETVPTV
jgi:hypothetical protein